MKTRTKWKLSEARKHLDEVFEAALQDGPQTVTVKGKKSVVIVDEAKYVPVSGNGGPGTKRGLVDLLLGSPLRGLDLKIERATDPPREIDLGADE